MLQYIDVTWSRDSVPITNSTRVITSGLTAYGASTDLEYCDISSPVHHTPDLAT